MKSYLILIHYIKHKNFRTQLAMRIFYFLPKKFVLHFKNGRHENGQHPKPCFHLFHFHYSFLFQIPTQIFIFIKRTPFLFICTGCPSLLGTPVCLSFICKGSLWIRIFCRTLWWSLSILLLKKEEQGKTTVPTQFSLLVHD